jgi:biotin transport system substrate-specific component
MAHMGEVTRITFTPSGIVRRSVAILGGALLVGLAAQVAVPFPGTPVPLTLQVPMVLFVAGVLGPRMGAFSMAVYLALGIAGLPVFAPVGAPAMGLARLLGPTGGYLLAFPAAAALAGHLMRDGRSTPRLAVGLLAGLAVIYAGGIAQLAVLSGNVVRALRLGSEPFLLLDLLKLLVVGLILRRTTSSLRARLS